MYQIYITELYFECIVGILDVERINPQVVIVNTKIKYQGDYVNYAEVASMIIQMMQTNKYELLEDAIEDISLELKNKFYNIKSIKLAIAKPNILDNCIVGVTKKIKFKKTLRNHHNL